MGLFIKHIHEADWSRVCVEIPMEEIFGSLFLALRLRT